MISLDVLAPLAKVLLQRASELQKVLQEKGGFSAVQTSAILDAVQSDRCQSMAAFVAAYYLYTLAEVECGSAGVSPSQSYQGYTADEILKMNPQPIVDRQGVQVSMPYVSNAPTVLLTWEQLDEMRESIFHGSPATPPAASEDSRESGVETPAAADQEIG